jgi:hypothetical protein
MNLLAFPAALALLAAAGCSRPAPPARQAAADTKPAPAAPVSFVNRVWVVTESPQVALGEQRVFLSDSTLVMTSPQGKPVLGTWRVKDGQLSITEEGREYPVEVLELSADLFRIRIRGPGEPVYIQFGPAAQPSVPLQPSAGPEGSKS